MPQAVDAWDRFGKDRTIVTKLRCQAGVGGVGAAPVLPRFSNFPCWERLGPRDSDAHAKPARAIEKSLPPYLLYGSKLQYCITLDSERGDQRPEPAPSAKEPTSHRARGQSAGRPRPASQRDDVVRCDATKRCRRVLLLVLALARRSGRLEATNTGGVSEKCSFG
jgi:hypothetical protein